jgi:hypothetical protein
MIKVDFSDVGGLHWLQIMSSLGPFDIKTLGSATRVSSIDYINIQDVIKKNDTEFISQMN